MRILLIVAALCQFLCTAAEAEPPKQPATDPIAKETGEAISKRILDAIPKLPKQITLKAAFERFGITDDTPVELVDGGSEGPGGLDHDFVFALGGDQSHLLLVEGSSTIQESARAAKLGEIAVVHVTSLSVAISGPRDDSGVPTRGKQLYPLWKSGTVVTEQSKGQQTGAGQPATRPESKTKGGNKPQPEPKPAPR